MNWPISSNLLDYLEIAPNPLRPFLWELELETDENGNLVPYGQTKDTVSNPSSWGLDTKQQWGNYRKSQLTKRDKVRGTGIFGLLPHNEWRSWSPEAKWRTYELGLESAWDDYGMESETFEAAGRGSKYPPQYLDLSETIDQLPPISSIFSSKIEETRTIITSKILSQRIKITTEIENLIKKNDIIYIDGYYIETCISIAEIAKKHNKLVIFDGGTWKEGYDYILDNIDIIVCSNNFYPPKIKSFNEGIHCKKKREICYLN